MIADEATPRTQDGGVALCHPCQRLVARSGSIVEHLQRKLARMAKFVEAEPKLHITYIAPDKVEAMSEEDAWLAVRAMRWPQTGGAAICPKCGHRHCYDLNARKTHTCANQACKHQFSCTSGTAFSSRKMTYKGFLRTLMRVYEGRDESAREISEVVGTNKRTVWDVRERLKLMRRT